MTATKHKATRDEDGDYEYRGRRISQDESVSKGYYGRWRIGSSTRFSTLGAAKRYIDERAEKHANEEKDTLK